MNIEKLKQVIKLAEGLEELDDKSKDIVIILRTLIAEENSAVTSYIEKAKKLEELGYFEISKVLLDIADEELVHAGELQAVLIKEGLSGEEQALKGAEEVEELIKGDEE